MGKTGIEWTEMTWNPVVGCSVTSPGCTHCYAMRRARMLQAQAEQSNGAVAGHYRGTTRVVNGHPVWTGVMAMAPDAVLLAPLRRKTPTTWFVNSMSDLFHPAVPDAWIDRVFAVMALCPQHDFQVLTKRAARMRAYCSDPATPARIARVVLEMARTSVVTGAAALAPLGNRAAARDPEVVRWPLPNVWKGVSIEDQKRAAARLPDLLATPAALRFVSAEPLLGPIELAAKETEVGTISWLRGFRRAEPPIPALDWIIVGGESGPRARPMHPDWVRSLRDQCEAAAVPFFFKQWGEWAPVEESASETQEDEELRNVGHWIDGQYFRRVGKARAGRLLDGVLHDARPGMAS